MLLLLHGKQGVKQWKHCRGLGVGIFLIYFLVASVQKNKTRLSSKRYAPQIGPFDHHDLGKYRQKL